MNADDDKTRMTQDLTHNVARTGVGTQLSGIYELDERIASGGMGEVYRGHNIQTGDHVAIKIVLPEFARDQTILSLFRKEASILNRLSHDAVVRYHVFTIDPGIGRPYLAMEFVDGEPLFEVMRRGPMAPDAVRRLCHRLASGLSAVHRAGAVHRDLSPDNIILPGGRVDRAKIIDFGIARLANVGGETLIGGKFAGKYNYVSPEQIGLYGAEVSEKSDIYSLGLVLAAALRGKPIDMGGTQLEIVEKRRVVPDLTGIDETLRPIIEAMLQPDPQARPAKMADIAKMTKSERPEDADEDELPGQAPHRTAPQAAAGTVMRPPGEASPAGRRQGPDDTPPSAPAEAPSFVPHVPPAHLSTPRQQAPQPAPAAAVPVRSAGRRGVIPAMLAGVVVLAGAGGYFGGYFGSVPKLWTQMVGPREPETAQPKPHAKKPAGTGQGSADGGVSTVPTLPQAGPTASANSQPGPARPEEQSQDAGRGAAVPPVNSGPQATAPASRAIRPEGAVETGKLPAADKTQQAERAPAGEADRMAWLRAYDGGECFYGGGVAGADNALAIEGFGTSVEPFTALRTAFQAQFHVAPLVTAQLIAPPQCPIAGFLRALDTPAAEAPGLVLDRTAVPNMGTLSGTLSTRGGLISHILLIDHKGKAFNLDDSITVQAGKASFSIPIGLGAADNIAGKTQPQVMLVITGPDEIQAADFKAPTSAAEVLSKILAEIRTKKAVFSATAKYFRLGG